MSLIATVQVYLKPCSKQLKFSVYFVPALTLHIMVTVEMGKVEVQYLYFSTS